MIVRLHLRPPLRRRAVARVWGQPTRGCSGAGGRADAWNNRAASVVGGSGWFGNGAAMTGANLGLDAIPATWRQVEGYDRLIDLAHRLYSHHITL